jgi:hypothetical protein
MRVVVPMIVAVPVPMHVVMAMPVAVFVVVHFLVFYVDPSIPVRSLLLPLLDG